MHPKMLVPIVACLFVHAGFGSVSFTQAEPFTATTSTADRQLKIVFTRIGDSVSFRWNSNQNDSISYCRWDRVIPYDRNRPSVRLSVVGFPDVQNNVQDGYSINIDGLHDGYCELTIASVQEVDLTLWNCTVIDKAVRQDGLALGSVNLTSLVKPSSPKLNEIGDLVDVSDMGANIIVDIFCCTYDGRPSPKLTIALNGEVIRETPGLGPVNNSVEVENQSCLAVPHYPLNWTHNGKKLTCVADHPGYEETDLKRDSIVLNIFHEPQILSKLDMENEITFTMDKSEDKKVFVEFVSNPFAEIHWLMKTESGTYEDLPPDLDHALVQNLQHGSWKAELNTKELLNSASFSLIIKNRYGCKEVHVNVEIDGKSGTSWGWIVIYLVSGLAVITICGFLTILLLKRKGWLCYSYDEPPKRGRKLYSSPDDIDDPTVPMRGDDYELNPTLIRTKEPVRTREGTVYVAQLTTI